MTLFWEFEYFVAVAEEGSIALAAKRLGMAASPLSRHIKELEKELGAALFEHKNRRIKLTSTGAEFLRDTRKLLAFFEDAKRRAQRQSPMPSTKLYLGFSESPTTEFLDRAVSLFEKRFAVHVVRCELEPRKFIDRIREKSLDVALMVLPLHIDKAGVSWRKLIDYPVECLVAPNHRFAKRKSIRPDDLRKEIILIFSRKEYPLYYQHFRNWFKPLGFRPKIIDDYDGLDSLLPAVASDHGIALLLQPAARLHAGVSRIPIRPSLSQASVGAVFLEPVGPLVNEFIKSTADAIAKRPAR